MECKESLSHEFQVLSPNGRPRSRQIRRRHRHCDVYVAKIERHCSLENISFAGKRVPGLGSGTGTGIGIWDWDWSWDFAAIFDIEIGELKLEMKIVRLELGLGLELNFILCI